MGRLRVRVDDKLERHFRQAAEKRFGKGTRALHQAFLQSLEFMINEPKHEGFLQNKRNQRGESVSHQLTDIFGDIQARCMIY
jgi:hypothetical protein